MFSKIILRGVVPYKGPKLFLEINNADGPGVLLTKYFPSLIVFSNGDRKI